MQADQTRQQQDLAAAAHADLTSRAEKAGAELAHAHMCLELQAEQHAQRAGEVAKLQVQLQRVEAAKEDCEALLTACWLNCWCSHCKCAVCRWAGMQDQVRRRNCAAQVCQLRRKELCIGVPFIEALMIEACSSIVRLSHYW